MNKNKNQINKILIILLLTLFPLNQQYHLRPFPSVEGFIIDYLILKVSIPEILIFCFIALNFNEVIEFFKSFKKRNFLILSLFLIFFSISIYLSNYFFLALYEHLVVVSLFIFSFISLPLLSNYKYLFIRSVKFWIVLLTLLSLFQFFNQSSVLNNYYLFGEFPYTEDHFHVKQKNVFFENLIPPYGIFSHSNILGGFVLILIFSLVMFRSITFFYHAFSIVIFILVGSSTVIFAYFLMLILVYFKDKNYLRSKNIYLAFFLFLLFVNTYLSFDLKTYISDNSIYRRIYMVDLSLKEFVGNPKIFVFGSGYFNYFSTVKDSLYNYELVRFFQPVHNSFFWLIWQYGFLFLIFIFGLVIYFWKNFSNFQIIFIYLVTFIGSLDHYLITNHQFKIIFMLFFAYSLIIKNKVKLDNEN